MDNRKLDWEEFQKSAYWQQMVDVVNESIEELRVAIETVLDIERLRELQGELRRLRWFLSLPETFKQEGESWNKM